MTTTDTRMIKFDMGLPYCIVWTDESTSLFVYMSNRAARSPDNCVLPRRALPRLAPDSDLGASSTPTFKQGVSHAANARVYVAISRSKPVRCLSYISIRAVAPHLAIFFFLLSRYP